MKPEAPLFSDEFFFVLNENYQVEDCCPDTEAFFERPLLGTDFLSFFGSTETRLSFRQQLENLGTGRSPEFEVAVQKNSGPPNPFLWRLGRKGSRIHVLGRNLLERNRRNLDAKKNLERLNLVLSANGTGIWEANHGKRELVWDDQMYRIHGLKREDFHDKHELHQAAYALITAEDLQRNNAELNKLRDEMKEINVRYRIHHPSGELRYIRAIGRPIAQNGERNYFGIAWDETEAFKNKNRQRDQEAKMLASAKMVALGEMSAGIAHEINNPLTVIQARSFQLQQLAETSPISPEKLIQAADSISKTADKIARIVRSLRAFAREGDNDAFDVVSLRQLFDETLEFCQTRFANNGVEIRRKPFSQLDFEGRRIQIEQILLNLLNNAFDAIQRLSEKWIQLEVQDHGKNFEIHIVDSGRGIPPDIAEKIMLPFFTTREVGHGMGLGLSISASIAKTHHGELLYDPQSEHTRFILRLPKFQS